LRVIRKCNAALRGPNRWSYAVNRLAAAVLCAAVLLLPAMVARAADDAVELTIKDHAFTPSELHVKAGQPITLRVRNTDASAEEFESPSLKLEKVVPAKGEATVRVRPLRAGRYPFVGEYHEDTAKGVLIAE
jgi:plastocyanin